MSMYISSNFFPSGRGRPISFRFSEPNRRCRIWW